MLSDFTTEKFKASLRGELIQRNDPRYDAVRKLCNGMIDRPPLLSHALRHDKPRNWPAPPGIEFADRVYSRAPSPDKLLIASPHFAAGKPFKPVSPVDAVSTPSYAGLGGTQCG